MGDYAASGTGTSFGRGVQCQGQDSRSCQEGGVAMSRIRSSRGGLDPWAGRRPKLLVAFATDSIGAMDIADAVSPLCEVVWLVDMSSPELDHHVRLLRKLGQVVDTSGRSPQEVAAGLTSVEPCGLVTFHDEAMVELAQIAEALGLLFVSPSVAETLVDKYLQRAALAAAGMEVPEVWAIPGDAQRGDIDEAVAAVRYPAVLKPRRGLSSRLVQPVLSASDLARALGELSPDDLTAGMMVEEYLEGCDPAPSPDFADYISVETLVSRSVVSHVAVSGRFSLTPPLREHGLFIPCDYPDAEQVAVLEVATAAVKALGVTNGCLHTEIKCTPKGPRVIEVNGRVGGGVPYMVRRATGFDIFEALIRVACGDQVMVQGPVATHQIAYHFIVQAPMSATKVLAIEGLGQLQALDGVESVLLNRAPGDHLDWRQGAQHAMFFVDGVAGDYAQLKAVDRYIREEVAISYG